jgi:hypothetical protein
MFGNITIQIAGYYSIALISIPRGYAHIRRNYWIGKVTLTLLWDWIILGLPLTIIVFFKLLTSKDLPQNSIPILILAFLLLYPTLPILLIRFYNLPVVKMALGENGSNENLIGGKPQIVLVVASLLVFFAASIHLPLLFNGLFPIYNRFISGLNGYLLIDGCILIFAILAWGVFKQKKLAWYGSVIFLVFMITSSASAFLKIPPAEIFVLTNFAELEREAIKNIPLQGFHLALFFVTPLVICVILTLVSGKHFSFIKSRL